MIANLSKRAQLRLELIRIVNSDGRVVSANLQRVFDYEKAFEDLLDDDAPAAMDAPLGGKKKT
ncbi:MAG: hypothetical protein AB7P35_17725 [Hyphomonadaceae bacterium]